MKYEYLIVEHSIVVRRPADQEGVNEVYEKGRWRPYDDDWDVATNGRVVTEEEAQHFLATGEE